MLSLPFICSTVCFLNSTLWRRHFAISVPPIRCKVCLFSVSHFWGTVHLSAFICVYLRLAVPLLAQNAELSGRISDPSGLAVPNTKVVVQSADTSATRTVFSNQQGEYSVPALLPGRYNITVDARGFKAIHKNGITVEVGQRARLDFALTIGSNTDTVTVQGTPPLLSTSDASVSTVIGNRFMGNMPLNGRSF